MRPDGSPPGHGFGAEAGAADLPAARRVLLLVDFVNPLEFEGAEALAPAALRAAQVAAGLKRTLARAGVPAVYVNDNFGRWHSDFRRLLAYCRSRVGPARRLVSLLPPGPDDLVVLKPRHSAFHATPLEVLLARMGTRELIVTGLATDLCVLFSAADAFVRGYRLWVPQDCCAAEDEQRHASALDWMRHALRARTSAAAQRRG